MLTAVATRAETFFDELRDREFGRLGAQNHVFVDYTGSALYGASQIRAVHDLLQACSATRIRNRRRRARAARFSTTPAEPYCNSSMSMIRRTTSASLPTPLPRSNSWLPFNPESTCVLSTDNHNSVNGIREYARRAGASIRNPGASEVAFGLDAGKISACFESLGHDFTVEQFASCIDKEIGAVRVSFGMANNTEDVDRTLDVIASFRD